MTIYFADWPNWHNPSNKHKKALVTKRLTSYYFYQDRKDCEEIDEMKVNLFLDSGAFSAWSKKVTINIDDYIAFINKYKKHIDVYANLDVIGDADATLKNQKYMESKGLNPIPTYHLGSDIIYLRKYADNYPYIALGGMAGTGTASKQIISQLDPIWDKYLTNDDGTAKIKVHGFACTGLEIITRYPWYSVDSTSWVMTGRFGGVFCDLGGFNKLMISEKGNQQDGAHWSQLPEHDQDNIREYFAKMGYTIEELMEEYTKRDEVNIKYFLALEKKLTENPPRFKQRQRELFDL
jgi:hypothetical protein